MPFEAPVMIATLRSNAMVSPFVNPITPSGVGRGQQKEDIWM
jgi:hypothetical protein